jgi:putative hydrolase of the HAD superfamily
MTESGVRYEAVFFDAGETLVYPHPSFPELFALVLREHGHEVEPERVREQLHRTSALFLDAARTKEIWTTSPERSRAFWHRVYQAIFDGLGLLSGADAFERLEKEFTDVGNYRLFPDVERNLRHLDRAGLKLGVVSNFEEWLERLLELLGVTPYFDVRVISGVEGIEKPDPAIFRLALERHGVAADRSVYVGDSPEFDIEPAESIGMLGVLIDRRGRHPDHGGVRITSLDDLPTVIGVRA